MLELKGVCSGYGKQTVISDVSLSFERGKITSVIGRNGCGKSTLLKTALGFLPLTGGEVLIDGQAVTQLKRVEIAKKIAYLQQGKDTPDMTVMQMVLHGRFPYLSYPRRYSDADKKIALNAMEWVGISHLAEKPLSTLSGGMRQNAYIAMALAQNADYLLLDEPTTYLDISHQFELMKLLQRLKGEGKGIVVVMHDLPMAFEFSDEIVVIEGGKVIKSGTPNELCESEIINQTFGVSVKRAEEDDKYYCK